MAVKVYEKGKKVQLSKNFTSTEFDCHGKGCCSQTSIDDKLVKYLQQFRDHFGKAVTINSGYRCPTHNASVGGASKSNHMDGEAADIKIKGITPLELAQYAESIGIKGIGVYSWGIHVDTRTSKYFWYDGGASNVKTFGGQATITTKPLTTSPTTTTPIVTNSKNSPLVTYTKISPNKNSPRNHTIDTITIHCIVGQWTAKQGCDYFAKSSVQASCNYVVGKDGSIGLCVEEKDRSWCSSNRANDNRAITIEVASDTTHPYAVTNAAYNALIELLVDICKRNNIKELKWEGDKSLIGQVTKQNMTVHRWFRADKECPGDYLYERHGEIAAAVNKKLGVASSQPVVSVPKVEESKFPYLVRINTALLNVRAGAGTNYKITTRVKKNEVYTIVDEVDGWGKLKSGAGWISLKYTIKK